MNSNGKYIILTPFFPDSMNHIGSYIYDQAKTINSLSEYNVNVIKLTSIFSTEKDYVFKGIQVKIFKVIDFPFFIFPGFFHKINAIRIIRFFKSRGLSKNLKVLHAHVCYPGAYLANSLSTQFRAKIFVQHHGLDVLQLLNCRFSILRKLQRKYLIRRSLDILNMIGSNIGVSNKVINMLNIFPDYIPSNEYVLYNGVDRTKFYDLNLPKKNKDFTIGCVANFF